MARRRCNPGLLFLLEVILSASQSKAQTTIGPVTLGAGLRTDFTHTEPSSGTGTNQFEVGDARIYISGSATENIKFMFNTDYDSASNKIEVLDAAAQFDFDAKLHIWAGRFLPPSDRSNLYGPFYAHQWGVYTDGIQDGYPFKFQGRDNGVVYWGDFFNKKMKLSVGAFDGNSTDGNPKVLYATRVQFDFWDPEDGYYLNGTYYGDKNLLALGVANQVQDGHTATTVDFLMEKKLPNAGVFSIESEYSNYNRLGGYDGAYAKSQGAYGLASYLFPKAVNIGKVNGKFELLGKFARAEFTHGGKSIDYAQKTTEINFNYVIKQFKARVMTFYRDTRFDHVRSNFYQAGVGLQIQI